jgi:hypothetical protein
MFNQAEKNFFLTINKRNELPLQSMKKFHLTLYDILILMYLALIFLIIN